LRTETVKVFDEYAFVGKWIREVLKQIDPTNIKIMSTMARIGPRNLLEVSRITGIPATTVYNRIGQIESKSQQVVKLMPTVAKLSLVRIAVLVSAKPGLEAVVTQALRIPNYWRVISRCEGAFTHHSVQTVPAKFLKEFHEYLATMQAMNLIKSYRIIQTGDSYPFFADFSYYNSSRSEWLFSWEEWFNDVKTGIPTVRVTDPRDMPINFDKVDLEVLAWLEVNGRMGFNEIAEKIHASTQTVKYHYDNRLLPAGLVERFDYLMVPYPVEISSYHEVMLEFPDPLSMNRFFSIVKKLFFIGHVAKVLRKNTLLVRTRIPDPQVEQMFTFFSEMVNAGQLSSYSSVRLNMSSRLQQTLSPELYENETGWQWDIYKNLLALNKL